MSMLGVLSMALFLAVNPANAVTPNPPNGHNPWTGVQAPSLLPPPFVPLPDYSQEVTIRGKVMIVKISGMWMATVNGYKFGDVTVAWERIDDLTIIMTPKGLPYPIWPALQPEMYLYPHHGKITWYDAEGIIVGTGTFGSRGGNVGSLVVNGPGLHVKGEYGLWVGENPYLVGHEGWYVTTDTNT